MNNHRNYRKKYQNVYHIDTSHFVRNGPTKQILKKKDVKGNPENVKIRERQNSFFGRQNRKKQREIKRKKLISNQKKKDENNVVFYKQIKMPGKGRTLTVSSKNLKDQIDFLYLGKSYHLTLKGILKRVGKSFKSLRFS